MLDKDNFILWFTTYADVLFQNFGDRVKQWLLFLYVYYFYLIMSMVRFTFNEPFCFSVYGVYGDQDPYTIAHNTILTHASVANLYRSTYQPTQKGIIGIVLNTAHFYPMV